MEVLLEEILPFIIIGLNIVCGSGAAPAAGQTAGEPEHGEPRGGHQVPGRI